MIRPLRINTAVSRTARIAHYGARPEMSRRAALSEGMGDVPRDLPWAETLPAVRKVVLNAYPNKKGLMAFEEMTGETYTEKVPHHHPALVWLAERRPQFFEGPGWVVVKEVPGGVYRIEYRDGYEFALTPDQIEWTTIR